MNKRSIFNSVLSVTVLLFVVYSFFPSRPLWWPINSPHQPQLVSTSDVHPVPVKLSPKCSSHAHRGFQAGLNVYWNSGTMSPAAISMQSRKVINYLLSLHANAVKISFPLFISGVHSSTVFVKPEQTPTPAQLSIFLNMAHKCGITTTLRPLLSEMSLKVRNWRGSIRPHSISSWFRSYERLMAPYLTVAQDTHVRTFVIGTELDSLSRYVNRWRGLIKKTSHRFSGQLAYDGSTRVPSPLISPKLSVQDDLWPSIDLRPSASQRSLDHAWRVAVREHHVHHAVVAELGIAALSGAYHHPAEWYTIGPPTAYGRILQKRWFIAACRALKDSHAHGIYWWEIRFSDMASVQEWDQFSIYNTPAEQAVKQCFAH